MLKILSEMSKVNFSTPIRNMQVSSDPDSPLQKAQISEVTTSKISLAFVEAIVFDMAP